MSEDLIFTVPEVFSWWHGHTVRCEGCSRLFPALDGVSQVVTVRGDPCGWHRGFLDPVTEEDAEARRDTGA